MKKLLLACALLVCFACSVNANREISSAKLRKLAAAIARTEGFGVKGAVPTRFHNPGDIRTTRPGVHYPGQIGVSSQHYVIFRNDKAGFAALESNLRKIATGRSKNYKPDMTLNEIGRVYAKKWRVWAENVAKKLDVSPDTSLRELLRS